MEFLFTWGTALMWILQNFKNTFLKQKWTASFGTMFIWIQLNNLPNSNLMTSIIFTHRTGNTYTVKILNFIRSSRPEMFRFATSLKKRLWHRCFPVNFVKFIRTPFSIEDLWWLLLDRIIYPILFYPIITAEAIRRIRKDSKQKKYKYFCNHYF